MKSIQVFDPALCCSSGVCGVDVDQQLLTFAADVEWAKQQGITLERFNLARQPLAFAQNAAVRRREAAALLELPAGLLDLPTDYVPLMPFNLVGLQALRAFLGSREAQDAVPGAAASPVGRPALPSLALRRRAAQEWPQIEAVREHHAKRVALVPMQADEPIGVPRLLALAEGGAGR